MSSLKKLIAASAIAVVITSMWSSQSYAAPIIHNLTLTETSPGGGGPFSGTLVIDDSLLGIANAGSFISQSAFDSFEISLYGTTFSSAGGDTFEADAGVLLDAMGMVLRFDDPNGLSATIDDRGGGPDVIASLQLAENGTWTWQSAGSQRCTNNSNFCSGSLEISKQATDMPEPATLSLFGAGLAGLAFLRRRKRTS